MPTPTKYTPQRGQEFIDLMTTGLSITASAAELNLHRNTVLKWEGDFPEFAEAMSLARGKRQLFFERRLISAKESPVVVSTIFALKNLNPKEWSDRQITEHSGPNGGPIETSNRTLLEDLSPEERDALRAIIARRTKPPAEDAQ